MQIELTNRCRCPDEHCHRTDTGFGSHCSHKWDSIQGRGATSKIGNSKTEDDLENRQERVSAEPDDVQVRGGDDALHGPNGRVRTDPCE